MMRFRLNIQFNVVLNIMNEKDVENYENYNRSTKYFMESITISSSNMNHYLMIFDFHNFKWRLYYKINCKSLEIEADNKGINNSKTFIFSFEPFLLPY